MNCSDCKNNTPEPVPYIVHESDMARLERSCKRWFILLIISILLLVGTNIGWLIYESRFETVETIQEVEQDAENGVNNFVGGDFSGEAES